MGGWMQSRRHFLQAAMYLSGELPVRLSAETVQPAGDPRFTEIFSTVRAELYFPQVAWLGSRPPTIQIRII